MMPTGIRARETCGKGEKSETRFAQVAPVSQVTRSLVAIACLTLLVSPLEAAEIKPQRFVMPNGLTVLVVEQHALPIVQIQALVKTGSVQDPPEKAGRLRGRRRSP